MLNSQALYPAQTETISATCPDCGQSILLTGRAFWGRKVTCPNCDTQLTVGRTAPVQLCLAYEEWDVDELDW
jgi:uncharacterized paraquat-inducible protein A